MKNLIEIAKIVTKKKVRKIEIFDDYALRQKNSKFNEFYEGLTSGKFKNDRDAANLLYRCNPQNPKYRQLKSRFKKRILNTLFFLDVNKPSTSNYERAYFSCNKEWALVQILQSNGATDTAASIARHVLSVSLKFRFADLIVNCSRVLRAYAANNDHRKDFELYDSYIRQFSEILEAEIRSEERYQLTTMQYRQPLTSRNDLLSRIGEYGDDLIHLSEKFESPVIFYNMYLVWIMRFELDRDFDSILEICDKAEKYVKKNPDYYQEEKLVWFHTKRMSAYLHLRDFLRGRVAAEKYLNQFPENSEHWFVFMEYYLLLFIHSENYIQALAILNRALSNPAFRKLESTTKVKWYFFEGYLHFIMEFKRLPESILPQKRHNVFQVGRFLEQPPEFPREQRIFQVHALILQILFLLERHNQPLVKERIEHLKVMANRQLNKEEHFRTIQFIRLLQALRKTGFQAEDSTKIKKHEKELQHSPFFYRGAIAELEIIPYESLWELIRTYFN